MADQGCSNRINVPFGLSSSSTPWRDFHHHATRPSTTSWNNAESYAVNLWENHNHSNSSPCDQEDISITASNHSSLISDEFSHRFVQPAAGNNCHLWNQILSGVGGGQEMPYEVGENLLNALSLKSFSGGMFEPSACSDYLKKVDARSGDKWADNGGDHFPTSNSYNKPSLNNNIGYAGDSNLIESDKLSTPNPINSWPIAPPDQSVDMVHLDPHPCNNFPPTDQNLTYQPTLFDHMGHTVGNSSFESFINISEYGYRSIGANWRPKESSLHYQNGLSPSFIDPFSRSRSDSSSKPLLKSLSLLDSRKHHGNLSKPLINKGSESGLQGSSTAEAKKKKLDDISRSSGSLKKPKHESSSSSPSTASSNAKMTNSQTPKVKIAAEKISALQQIVSPYGKTDTASVLQEAIGFIKCLQDQVQLLSNPYLKSGVNKLQEAWGSLLDKKHDKGEINKVFDLKSKGLCLVPTSRIPQAYKDNSGPDYWPTYRGCLYR